MNMCTIISQEREGDPEQPILLNPFRTGGTPNCMYFNHLGGAV